MAFKMKGPWLKSALKQGLGSIKSSEELEEEIYSLKGEGENKPEPRQYPEMKTLRPKSTIKASQSATAGKNK
jgi:hypothetical protein